MFRRTKAISILILTVIFTSVFVSCAPSTRNGSSQTYTIAVAEDDPGEVDNPNPQSTYSGVALAAAQLRQHAGINIVVVPYADNGDIETARENAGKIVDSDALAVIGHSTIETSQAAAETYDEAGVPALNAMPVTETLTDNYPYYFNTTYTAQSEAAYLANYLRKIKGAETASIISTDDGYGQTLAKQFRNTFTGLGGTVTIESVISGSGDLELDDIAHSYLLRRSSPGSRFPANN